MRRATGGLLCILTLAAAIAPAALGATTPTQTTRATPPKVHPCVAAGRAAVPVRKLPKANAKISKQDHARIQRQHDAQLAKRHAYIEGCLVRSNSATDDNGDWFVVGAGAAVLLLLAFPYLIDLIKAYGLRQTLARFATDKGFSKTELAELIEKPLGGVVGLARALIAFVVIATLALALFYLLAKRPFANSSDIADHLLTILGTLATAVTAFYFGSRTSEQATENAMAREETTARHRGSDAEAAKTQAVKAEAASTAAQSHAATAKAAQAEAQAAQAATEAQAARVQAEAATVKPPADPKTDETDVVAPSGGWDVPLLLLLLALLNRRRATETPEPPAPA